MYLYYEMLNILGNPSLSPISGTKENKNTVKANERRNRNSKARENKPRLYKCKLLGPSTIFFMCSLHWFNCIVLFIRTTWILQRA